jgi:hypothetical protein
MIHTAEANCLWCKHYLGEWKCRAFPESIPDDFRNGKNLHREPVEGDNGYQYERAIFEIPPIDDDFLKFINRKK